MAFNPDIHHRHSIRLRDYDYSSNGAYFLSLCTRERKCDFGEIIDGSMYLNEVGCLVESCWRAIAENFPDVKLDSWVIMPNHLHGIIIITDAIQPVGAKQASSALPASCLNKSSNLAEEHSHLPLHGTNPGSLSAIVQNFKSISTRKINRLLHTPESALWQRNYYERIIRNENELERARTYIVNNPIRWSLDKENPANCP
jgi:putative transposase